MVNTRLQKRDNNIWRRRSCGACGAVFTTIEAVALTGSLLVINKTTNAFDTGQPFVRDKLYLSIFSSLRHRPTASQDATALTSTAIGQIINVQKDAIIDSRDIARTVYATLQRFDVLAAAVYKGFRKDSFL